VSLDTSIGVIKNLIYHQFINTRTLWYYEGFIESGKDERTDIVITLSDIPFTLSGDGSISCVLKGKDIASHLKLKYVYSNSEHDGMKSYIQIRTDDVKMDDIKDDAEIVINMKK
jgi:hypothetical protein